MSDDDAPSIGDNEDAAFSELDVIDLADDDNGVLSDQDGADRIDESGDGGDEVAAEVSIVKERIAEFMNSPRLPSNIAGATIKKAPRTGTSLLNQYLHETTRMARALTLQALSERYFGRIIMQLIEATPIDPLDVPRGWTVQELRAQHHTFVMAHIWTKIKGLAAVVAQSIVVQRVQSAANTPAPLPSAPKRQKTAMNLLASALKLPAGSSSSSSSSAPTTAAQIVADEISVLQSLTLAR
ncbi:hypothetical protein AXG93_3353s1000 [Marchantia polymorpha subsp. ruderalis]|uniref:Uncharacterized protein n=1 Tax=Marchantia polymorpha subsp. ruderalis TaxID=1480154 RepID=A0A176VK36_MARPO|nr:hypothetical protein AXG93_3353s1000 [Marchantia polymorpha subsp. ruderalis]